MNKPVEDLQADLRVRWKKVALLESTLGLLGWDEQVMMPPASVSWRGEQMAYLSGLLHSQFLDPGLLETLAGLENSPNTNPLNRAGIREARRRQKRAALIPPALVEEMARTCSQAQPVWAKARAESNFPLFQPLLEKIVRLKQEEAEAVGWTHHPYNALLDEFEPGMDVRQLDSLFGQIEGPLAKIAVEAREKGETNQPQQPLGDFPPEQQKLLGEAAAKALGFNFDAGRLDTSTHPFCSGIGPGDCRLTTRYQRDSFLESFFGVLHETGHGLYEQGLPEDKRDEPWCQAASLGMHESQSRLWENLVGRTREFWQYFHPIAQAFFGKQLNGWPLEKLIRAMRQPKPSFIRVEADETTYNLHILLRYKLEKAMVDGSLAVKDLPDAWNQTFEKYFGIKVPDDRRGCLQDIHWSGGGIGYFPTYTLGNLYAAQLMEAAKKDLGPLESDFTRGSFHGLLGWLRKKVHRIGRSLSAQEICLQATGQTLVSSPLLNHLNTLTK